MLLSNDDTHHKGLIYDTQHSNCHYAGKLVLISVMLTVIILSIQCPVAYFIHCYAGCCFTECRMLCIAMLNVVIPSAVMLSVVAPK
jgi:hypothetical protein